LFVIRNLEMNQFVSDRYHVFELLPKSAFCPQAGAAKGCTQYVPFLDQVGGPLECGSIQGHLGWEVVEFPLIELGRLFQEKGHLINERL